MLNSLHRSRRHTQQQHEDGDQQVECAGEGHGTRQARLGYQHKGSEQRSRGGANAVEEIQTAEYATRRKRLPSDQSGAHHRERHAEQNSLRQDQHQGDGIAAEIGYALRMEARKPAVEQPAGHQQKHRMERESEQPYGRFQQAVGAQQTAEPTDVARGDPRPECHAAHERRQHQRLRIGGVAEDQSQILRPDRLIDEPTDSGQDKKQQHQGQRKPRRAVAGVLTHAVESRESEGI